MTAVNVSAQGDFFYHEWPGYLRLKQFKDNLTLRSIAPMSMKYLYTIIHQGRITHTSIKIRLKIKLLKVLILFLNI